MTFTPDTARAWVDVDLGALAANARTLAALSGSRLLPMVKANGYGLGAVAVARALEPLEPWGFGVATVEEGAALRAAGIARPILVFSPLLPTPSTRTSRTISGPPSAIRPRSRPGARAASGPFHVEIDTGMSRARHAVERRAALGGRAFMPRGGARLGRGLHALSQRGHGSRRPRRVQWERFQDVLASLPAPSAARACRQQRRRASRPRLSPPT